MINPKRLVNALVASLSSIPQLVQALQGTRGAGYIAGYVDLLAKSNDVSLAIRTMQPGSILVVWQGTRGLGTQGKQGYQHEFTLYLRAPESDDIGYEDLFYWIVNGVPAGQPYKFIVSTVDPACDPPNLLLPEARRGVLQNNESTQDYFEVPLRLAEMGNPDD